MPDLEFSEDPAQGLNLFLSLYLDLDLSLSCYVPVSLVSSILASLNLQSCPSTSLVPAVRVGSPSLRRPASSLAGVMKLKKARTRNCSISPKTRISLLLLKRYVCIEQAIEQGRGLFHGISSLLSMRRQNNYSLFT